MHDMQVWVRDEDGVVTHTKAEPIWASRTLWVFLTLLVFSAGVGVYFAQQNIG